MRLSQGNVVDLDTIVETLLPSETRGEIRTAWDLAEAIKGTPVEADGTLTRLILALRSASHRAGVTYTAQPITTTITHDSHDQPLTLVDTHITIDSGKSLGRDYHTDVIVRVGENHHGIHRWEPMGGAITVSSAKDKTVHTIYTGRYVAQVVGSLYFARGCARNEMHRLCSHLEPDENSDFDAWMANLDIVLAIQADDTLHRLLTMIAKDVDHDRSGIIAAEIERTLGRDVSVRAMIGENRKVTCYQINAVDETTGWLPLPVIG